MRKARRVCRAWPVRAAMVSIAGFIYVALRAPPTTAQTIYQNQITGSDPGAQADIHWNTNPQDQYDVLTAPSPNLGIWTSITPQAISASNFAAGLSVPLSDASGLFSVKRRDTEPPVIAPLSPPANGVAVFRAAPLQVTLTDENEIDTNSVVFTLNGTNYPLASPSLALNANLLTFTNAVGFWGDYGATVNVSVAASDILGNAGSNSWSFTLELEAVPQTNVLVIGSGSESLPTRSSVKPRTASTLTLIATYSNSLVFSYTGSPDLNVGELLASSDPGNIFYRQITDLSTNEPSSEITAITIDVRLENFLQSGSINNVLFTPVGGAGLSRPRPAAAVQWNALQINESGSLGNFDTGSGSLKLDGSLGTWSLQAAVNIAADISLSGLDSCDINVSGSLDVNIKPELVVTLAGSVSKEEEVISPIRSLYVGFVGTIPVWVEVVYELKAGASLSAGAQGTVSAATRIERDLAFATSLRFNTWSDDATDTGWVVTRTPVQWQINANVNAATYLKPKITAYIVSLAGAYVGAQPQISYKGTYQQNPVKYRFEAKAEMEVKAGLDARGWNSQWGSLPSWTLASLSEQIFLTNYPPDSPSIVSAPEDVNCQSGATARFSVEAESEPTPSYQWYHESDPIPQATSPEISFRATSEVTGEYSVVISNTNGATNATASLSFVPDEMALIPAGPFAMGDSVDAMAGELPVHTVNISAFYMDKYEVSKTKWDDVYGWALANGYGFDHTGSAKAPDHPVQTVSWYDAVKWCNARSEMQHLRPCYYTDSELTAVYRSGQVGPFVDWGACGYRLPTEAEWEKAARGGLAGLRFPTGDTITWHDANYASADRCPGGPEEYDHSPHCLCEPWCEDFYYHPYYTAGGTPYTAPVAALPSNGYGLYNMAGNVMEFCWDVAQADYYASSPDTDPHGPDTTGSRVSRGGYWGASAYFERCSGRTGTAVPATLAYTYWGFRTARETICNSVEFSAASASGVESNSPAALYVTLAHDATSTVTVHYAVSGGTANASDYTIPSGVLVFNPGERNKNIPNTIDDDSDEEPDETINLLLTNPKGASLGAVTQMVYTIINDDFPPPP